MEFKFKRKYTLFFFFALILNISAILFWFLSPEDLFNNLEDKKIIFLLIFTNIELLLVFYLGLFRKKYYAYHDKLLIKKSLFPDTIISYKDITAIKERNNDTVFLGFGHRPSFTIYYKNPKRRKITIRSDNSALILKVIKTEIDIAKTK